MPVHSARGDADVPVDGENAASIASLDRLTVAEAPANNADGEQPALGPEAVAMLAAARKEAVFSYDTHRFPFRELFRRYTRALTRVHAPRARRNLRYRCNHARPNSGPICRMFQLADGVSLDKVHNMELPDRAPLSLAFIHAFKVAGRKTPKTWNKALSRKKDRLKKFIASKARAQLAPNEPRAAALTPCARRRRSATSALSLHASWRRWWCRSSGTRPAS
jgi:hypothetical protein